MKAKTTVAMKTDTSSAIILLLSLLLLACDSSKPVSPAGAESQMNDGAAAKPEAIDAQAVFESVPVGNFKLLDHEGKAHELYYYDDARAIVIMIHGNGCPIVRNSLKDYEALAKKYRLKNVRFFYLNANLQDNRDSISEEVSSWGVSLPVLIDDTQIVGRELNLSRTAEILIIEPRRKEIVYRGPLHDRVSYESQTDRAGKDYADTALSAVLAKQAVPMADQPVKGCLINFPEVPMPSYQADIAPMLINHCVSCHQEGGIAPWAMNSHAMIKGFAPMIKEVIRTKRMPPYGAVPHIGEWQDNPLPSKEQVQQLFAWIDAGAPIGEGGDPLAEQSANLDEWAFGEPDLIIDIPAFEIPATGLIDYRYAQVANTHGEDVWLRAATIKPGDPLALHHLNVGVSKEGLSIEKAVSDNYLLVWTPGTNTGQMPEGTGVFLPKNANFLFEMHYTTYGKASVDASKLGLYFAKQKPEKIMRFGEVADALLKIPPNRRSHMARAYNTFDHDATVYIFGPHAHYRGKRFKFYYQYPDGSEELALSVPNYNFNWQRSYSYVEPKKVPAGTRLVVSTEFDNSIFNEANPDPFATVIWGPQSEDEMLLGGFAFSWDDETSDNVIHDSRKWFINRMVGYLDVNLDGKITESELPVDRRPLFQPFAELVDADNDGAVTYKEWLAMPEVEFR